MNQSSRIVLLVLSILLIFGVGGLFLWKHFASDPNGTSNPDLIASDPFTSDPTLGDPDAPITMIEYSDFQCPYCRIFFNESNDLIKENYIDTGKVKLIFKQFPLTSIHPDALMAANASECVYEQGGSEVFFEYHDMIFEGQNQYGQGTAPIPKEDLLAYGETLGLDMDSLETCMDEERYYEVILEEEKEGYYDLVEAGIPEDKVGTPAFLINGEPLSGAQPYSEFQKLFDSLD